MAQHLRVLAVLAEGPKGVQFWEPTLVTYNQMPITPGAVTPSSSFHRHPHSRVHTRLNKN